MPDGVATALSQAGIPLLTSQDAEFTQTLNSYTGIPNGKPTVVALPTTSEQVAVIVTLCIETNSDMVVRGGGHDTFGRFSAHNAVVIDLRKLNAVVVSEDKSTVRVGGGVTASRVLDELEKHGLQVPVGSCGSVGFTSWCLVGGLGPYSESYGLGADQIVGAKMVDARGRLVDADERLLKGLRGGGGCLGVVVELTVKAYPLQNVSIYMFGTPRDTTNNYSWTLIVIFERFEPACSCSTRVISRMLSPLSSPTTTSCSQPTMATSLLNFPPRLALYLCRALEAR